MNNKEEYLFYLWTTKTPPIKYLTELLRDLLTEGNTLMISGTLDKKKESFIVQKVWQI